MNSIKKILSSTLAATVVLSCCAINVFAAPSAHTYTVSADKTEGLVAGDTVTVEVKIDSTENIFSAGYELYFDPAVFNIDTASGGRGKPKKYIDTEFNTNISDTNGPWGWYLGAPTVGESATDGFIKYGWGGNTGAGSGVIADDNLDNYTIGKFFLTVKDGVANGNTEITIAGSTFGYGENTQDTMTYVPLTLTVGTPGPSIIEVTGITLDKTEATIDLANEDKTVTLKATVEPADATDPTVTWTSSDDTVATVDANGVVTAVAEGKATITAKAGEKTATCAVTVIKTPKYGDVIDVNVAKNEGKEDNVLYYVKAYEKGFNALGHAKIINKTEGKEQVSVRTIADMLGVVAEDGATIEGGLVVIVSGPVDNAFDFEIVE